ncbi:hypothetical protein TL16_g03575 [Triparma laevis f. inornata]|uniref:Uncharacterized protein n=1 Tax=Triparma laevis f. inornata TaxID=1714386 RepID=A0A9W7E580_9STRA|nr:hypothetical protein TL16_g03575 [Triparma laevis f. inornata]
MLEQRRENQPMPSSRIMVYWTEKKEWFAGVVSGTVNITSGNKRTDDGLLQVRYDDRDVQVHDFGEKEWKYEPAKYMALEFNDNETPMAADED